MCKNLSGVVVARGVGEGEHRILGLDRGGREKVARTVVGEFRVGHGGGLRAVEGVPDDGRASDRVVGVNRAGVQDGGGGRGVPEEGIGRVRILRQPALDGLDLARAEARERGSKGRREAVGVDGNLDLEFLLVKDHGHEEFVGVEVHVVGDGHATVDHTQLLDLKLGHVEGGGREGGGRAVVQPKCAGRGQGTGDLYLLGEGVRRERDIEAIGAGHTPNRDDDVGVLVDGEVTRARRTGRGVVDGGAAQLEEGLGLGLRADLAEDFCQKLLSRHEVLARSANTEGNLLNSGVAPALREGVVANLGGEGGRIVAERDDDVFKTISQWSPP